MPRETNKAETARPGPPAREPASGEPGLEPAKIAVMKRAAFLLPCLWLVAATAAAQVPAPETFFGFRMGADRELATWDQIQRYFEVVAARSDRVIVSSLGPTTDGRTLIAGIVSSPDNLAHLADIKAANRRLADPRTLAPEDAARLAATQRAIVAIGAGIHATEVGATQASSELLYRLATATDARTLAILREVVIVLIPSLNPDGHALVVDWYTAQKGQPWEGGPMPWLYHKYAGHDLNRDAFMQNMAENRTLATAFYREWHPHVFLTQHQMGVRGPRFFAPPNYDPIDRNYDPLIWRTAGLLGHAIALRLEQDGHSGVVQNAIYDYYWPGYEDSAPLGHNTVCLLTEAASVRVATPVNIDPAELRGSTRGLPEYRPQVNFPNPWPGGAWRLRDIVEYQLSASWGLLDAVARYREEIVGNFHAMARHAIEAGRRGHPFAFVIPADQHDPLATRKLIDLLAQGAVEIQRANGPFAAGGRTYAAGTQIVFMAQPFRAYAKTLLERQDYPGRRVPGDSADRPYDVAGWTLPYQMGVAVDTVDAPFEWPPVTHVNAGAIPPGRLDGDARARDWLITAPGTAGTLALNRLLAMGLDVSWLTSATEAMGTNYPAGSLVVRGHDRATIAAVVTTLGLRAAAIRTLPAHSAPVHRARVALYRPWFDNTDEGWTRWILEQYEFPYSTITDQDIRAGDLRSRFDVVILPDIAPDRLLEGQPVGTVPPQYTGGLGDTGARNLRLFVEAGGTLVSLDGSTPFAVDLFHLPLKNVAHDGSDVFGPGSILRIELDTSNPLAYGMGNTAGAFFSSSSAWDPLPLGDGHGGPTTPATLTPFARYADRNVLMSGWLEGEQTIAGRAAAVEARVNEGRIVLLGFRAQHRAQSLGTFRLLFNALYVSEGGRD